jgi:DNA invertase Pin-like site-specific DNA recombinase
MRAFGYVRVSTGDQAESGLGLETQQEAIEAECERRGWDLVRVFRDEGFSAATLKRPALQEALELLKGGGADLLVTSKLDRLSRSLEDFVGLRVQALREGWVPKVLDLPVDPETPIGEAMLMQGVVFAQLERRLASQRTRDALAVLSARSEPWVSRSGRTCTRLGRPSSVDGELRDRIRSMASAHGLSETARRLNSEGVPTGHGGRQWWASSVRSVVQAG